MFVSAFRCSTKLDGKKGGDGVSHPSALAIGTFVEFEEKSREHVGKITTADHIKGSGVGGSTRYHVVDSHGKMFDIPDKAITFVMHPPNSPIASDQLFSEFVSAHEATAESLHATLDISPEILELAWEESLSSSPDDGGDEGGDHVLTPSALIELVHSHRASTIEKYMAWKILRTDAVAHVFFREVKDHGRVVSFKAKARKAVDAARQAFGHDHDDDSDLCLVV